MVVTTADHWDLLDRLLGAFNDLAPELAPRVSLLVRKARLASLSELLDELTVIERTAGLRADLHGQVAQCKQVLTGAGDREDFLRRCYELAGMM